MPNGCRLEEAASALGDEGKAVGTAQAPAALLSFHNAMSRSVIAITEFAVSRRQKPVQGLRKSSGTLAIFAAIRRASLRGHRFKSRATIAATSPY